MSVYGVGGWSPVVCAVSQQRLAPECDSTDNEDAPCCADIPVKEELENGTEEHRNVRTREERRPTNDVPCSILRQVLSLKAEPSEDEDEDDSQELEVLQHLMEPEVIIVSGLKTEEVKSKEDLSSKRLPWDNDLDKKANNSLRTSTKQGAKSAAAARTKKELRLVKRKGIERVALLACNYCGKKLRHDYLTLHIRSHTGERPYKCMTCNKRFFVKAALTVHIRSHTGERPYRCAVCGNHYKEKSTLNKHMQIHTGVRPHGCIVCGRRFRSNGELAVHMRIHTGEQPYQCVTCGKCFRIRRALTKHTRSHTNERPYHCSNCDKRFMTKDALMVHMRSHTGERPYGCIICGKCFTTNGALTSHNITVHTKERPYECNVCEKRFPTSSSLKGHMRTHISVKRFKCNTCGKLFVEESQLSRHYKITHWQDNI